MDLSSPISTRMCETFLLYHLCGHVYSKKVWKCSRDIERQLELTKSSEDIPKYPVQPFFTKTAPCLDCQDPASFLKPTLCEKCEQVGVINDWLKSDPAMKFEIVKEWLRSKRAEKVAWKHLVVDSGTAKATYRNDAMGSSMTLSEETSGVRTPSTRLSTSSTRIIGLEDINDVPLEQWSPLSPEISAQTKPATIEIENDPGTRPDALEVMTPILTEYLSKAESVEAEAEGVEQKLERRAQGAKQDAKNADDLKARAAAVRRKLEALIADTKQRNLAR